MLLIPSPHIPEVVEAMMRNPHGEMKYPDQRITWAQAVYLSEQQYSTVNKLIQAFRTNL